jgi:starch synthase
MIAMRYGSVPIVRQTGGLADTVDERVGFTFKSPSSSSLYKAVRLALKAYGTPEWEGVRSSCMKKDFTWDKPAKEYLKIYKGLLG